MTSRFVNLFKKSDLDEQRAFQQKALLMFRERFPGREFTAGEDPLTLLSRESVLGLTNLRANFLLSSQSDSDLGELIDAQFDSIFNEWKNLDPEESSWDVAQTQLMPQLMPKDFLDKLPLVHFPFGDNIVIGFVIDGEKAYSYVREDQLEQWNVDGNKVRETALANLNERSQGIEMMAIPGDNGMFIVSTMDGFDAVRILDLGLQQLVAEHIGSPFYAGVPNRDFLICWSKNGDEAFQDQMRTQVAADFEERPYPLSGSLFEVGSDGSIRLTGIESADPRAKSAGNN